jgi:hypothetical protein
MIRKDGKYFIYIIQHQRDVDKRWVNSSDCNRWIPGKLTRKKFETIFFTEPWRTITACGKCWQETGVHGSYIKNKALRILEKVSKWNPGIKFRVCKLEIEQRTTEVAQLKVNK